MQIGKLAAQELPYIWKLASALLPQGEVVAKSGLG
jgi:hypothetical protein